MAFEGPPSVQQRFSQAPEWCAKGLGHFPKSENLERPRPWRRSRNRCERYSPAPGWCWACLPELQKRVNQK